MKVRAVVPHHPDDLDLINVHLVCHRSFSPGVEVKIGSTLKGNYSRACNEAAEGHDGLIVLLNDDTCPGPGWLDALLEDIKLIEETGINWGLLGGRCDVISGQQSIVDSEIPLNAIRPHPRIVTAAAAIRSSVWDEIGGFDERFPFWFSDDALSMRAEKAGYQNMIGTWYIRHFGSVGSNRRGTDFDSHGDQYRKLFNDLYGGWKEYLYERGLVPA